MRTSSLLSRLLDAVAGATSTRPGGRERRRTAAGPQPERTTAADRRRAPRRQGQPVARSGGTASAVPYPGDFTGAFRPVYAPHVDGLPDPGEIVWTWVPFEEDHTRGKDRPVLVVGKDGPWLLGLMLTSRDHDTEPDHRDEVWLDLGVGEWDARRRASEVRIDRVVRIDAAAVRREGAVLDRERFGRVAAAVERETRGRRR